MEFLPLFLQLNEQPCLVVGAGNCAARKIELLARAGAKITVIAPQISAAVVDMAQIYTLKIKQKNFAADDLVNCSLVVSATDDAEINSQVATVAKQLNVLVNVVDNPNLCTFIFPAIIDRSPIIAAVSSGGSSPVLARLLRAKIESLIPPAFGRLARFAEKFRQQVKHSIHEPSSRRIFWEKALQGSIAELIFSGHEQAAENLLLQSLDSHDNKQLNIGEVYLVGAGPGDPDLLTFRALRLMQQADVVVYDRLVSPQVLDLVRRDAEKIYVGKQRANHSLPQQSINELLAHLAQAGKRVVRLKGGDPFIFGRGGEEIETLLQQNINFQIVPGITAASGCATYAGIPLTHRDHAQSCTFVTGHLKDGSINLNWQQLASPNQTIVIYMGLIGISGICTALIEHGAPDDLPVAIVQQGTTSKQRILIGTLKSIPQIVEKTHITPPTIIIIGTVVKLHNQLTWFNPQQDS